MPLVLTPVESNESLPIGAYQATFSGVEETKTQNDTKDAWKWTWRTDKGQTIVAFTDVTPPTKANKVGRYLSALTGKPLTLGEPVTIDAFVGKRFLCVIGQHGERTRLETFTPLA